jgi:hypothetical protein
VTVAERTQARPLSRRRRALIGKACPIGAARPAARIRADRLTGDIRRLE